MEAKKVLRNLDLTCFRHRFKPSWDGRENQIYLMGTSEAFETLEPFFQNQWSMAQEFAVATREIFFQKPWEFTQPISKSETEGLIFNSRKVTLEFFDSLKIKLDIARTTSQIALAYPQLVVTCSPGDWDHILEVCRYRQRDQTHGIVFLRVDDELPPSIHCSPLGDWLAIE